MHLSKWNPNATLFDKSWLWAMLQGLRKALGRALWSQLTSWAVNQADGLIQILRILVGDQLRTTRTFSNWGFTQLEIKCKGCKSYLCVPGNFVLHGKATLRGYSPKALYLYVCLFVCFCILYTLLVSGPTLSKRQVFRSSRSFRPFAKRTDLEIFPLAILPYHRPFSLRSRKSECLLRDQHIAENTESSPWHFTFTCLWIVTKFKL